MSDLTRNEMEMMEVFWKEGRPLSRTEIIKCSPKDKSWKDSSVHILLNSLLKKGAIREAGYVRTGKGYGRTFEPVESSEEFFAQLAAETVRKISLPLFFSALFENEDISKETLEELETLIEEKKRKSE